MKIIEHYATKAGVVLPAEPAPFPVNYHALPVKRFITLSAKTGQSAKDYPNWQEVVKWLYPVLIQHGIYIVQLGEAGEASIQGTVNKLGLTFRESSFLVQNADLHLSGDSVFVHFAGSVKTPVVALYGSTLPEVTGPYYKGEFHAISARTDLPSYKADEADPQIAYITPETVVNKVFEVLGLKERVNVESIEFGPAYNQKQISFIPDFMPDAQMMATIRLVIRLDIVHNENVAAEVLKHRKQPCMIVADKPLTKDFLQFCKGKVATITQKFGEGYDIQSLIDLKESGNPYQLVWMGDKDRLGDIRFELLDVDMVYTPVKPKRSDKITKESYFKTNQAFLGRGKHYPTLWHYRHAQEQPGQVGDAIESDEFWESSDAYFFFKQVIQK